MGTLPPPTFGVLLRRARWAAGLSQEALAERAGLSVDAISALERGLTRAPHAETLDLLANALQVTHEERAAWEQATRGLRLPSDEAVVSLDDLSQPLTPRALPTGTVTLLFTDIEGSTQLLQQLGPAYAQALGEHQALLRAAFTAHGGVEVDTQGDAFFVAFATAPAAVQAAGAATRSLAAYPWPTGATLRVRMGVHTGTPQLIGDHYVGLDVHRAARIAAAGHGGQVLLSQTTRHLVEYDLPEGVTLRDLGAHRLKDLQQPERLAQLVIPELPADFPSLKTLDTHQHNLPNQPTPLLGREEELAALTAQLGRDEVRLVTLTGAGGIGKTRLAIQAAADLIEVFPDGVWFVRLSRLVDPALVMPTIAQALGLHEQGSRPLIETVRAHLTDKHLLLVLDNFERVVGAAGDVAMLLEVSPSLRVLVTSRVPLHLRGEHEYPLVPLPLPEHDSRPEELSRYAAVALFIERAQAARPDFAVTAANAPAIAEICARLDGLPLALELAAARVKVLPPEALLARLARGLQVLSGGARDAEERQQTMCATVAWSEHLLTPEEQVLFRRLSVFVGGCMLEAAEAICAGSEGAVPLDLDLLEGLSTLVDQSLLQQREEGSEPHFGLLQVIREYALERLERSGEAAALRRAHAAYFLALAEHARQQETGPETVAWRDRLEREHDNLRAALGWAREQGEVELGLRMAVALTWFWVRRGHLREGRAWLEGLLAVEAGETESARAGAGLAAVRAKALLNAGMFALTMGAYATAQTQLEQARALALAAGDPRTARQALTNLGRVASDQGDLEGAAALYMDSLALARELGDQRDIMTVLTNLGHVASKQGDLERAAALYMDSLEFARELGDRDQLALCLNNLGDVARRRGELSQATALLRDALAVYWELRDPRRCAMVLESLAETAGAAGQGERAARLLGAATALRETIGSLLTAPNLAEVAQAVAEARAVVGDDTWAAALAVGRTMTLEQAIAEALRETD